MRNFIFFMFFYLFSWQFFAQFSVRGKVTDGHRPLAGVTVELEYQDVKTITDENGFFELSHPKEGYYPLVLSKEGYEIYRKRFHLNGIVEFPKLFLYKKVEEHENDNVITLAENELDEEEGAGDVVSGVLQSTKDTYNQRASFDFGQVFFRPRGYDSKEANVLINGIPMAKVETGRAQWSNWGGLNDATRSQMSTTGVGASEYDFGGAFGSSFISVKPSENRSGLRVSATASNRSYFGRLMATYNSGIQKNGLGYFVSASRRWTGSNSGNYIDGMLYNSYATAGGIEYKINPYSSFNLVGIYSYNHRGKSSPLTREAITLGGRHYNPNWGYLNGNIRNSKMKRISEPIFILSHTYNKKNTKINTNIGYQFGEVGDTRIQYVKSQNPDPSYYTNMPTYYYNQYNPNDPTNHDPLAIEKTAKQIDFFKSNKQLDWNSLYLANKNKNGESLYAINEDIIDTKTLSANVLFSTKINDFITLNGGITYQNINTDNYQEINDLLGGKYFVNKSYYSNLWYNTPDEILSVGDKYQYHYKAITNKINGFAQLRFKMKKVDFYVATKFDHTDYQREGIFENNAIYIDSKGKGNINYFNTFSTKGGITYNITGRHILQFNTGYFQLPQTLNGIYLNIRNSNSVLPVDIDAEKQLTADVSYLIRMPYFKSRITGFATKFEDAIEKNFFFTQARVGDESAGFLSETMTNIEKLHYGIEFGAEVQIIPTLKATAVASVNDFRYTNNPTVMYSSDKQLVSAPTTAYMENYKIAAGPQQAYSLGLEYRSPKYWWVGATANWLESNYIDVAPMLRTSNIYIDPNTGSVFTNIDTEKVKSLLMQEKLPFLFLMNASAGKSWRVKDKFISVFLTVNNVLNTQFKAGGFEQARKGNYQAMLQDKANGYPVFGNKYFVGYGRNYFLNVAISF